MSDRSRVLPEKLLRRLSVESLGTLEGPTYDGIVQGLVQLTNALLHVLEQKGITSKAYLENTILARKRDRRIAVPLALRPISLSASRNARLPP